MRVIELTKGRVTVVDDDDFVELAQYRWHFNGRYAVRKVYSPNGERHYLMMHRVILGLPIGRIPEVDHRNLNGLDNRKENLRVATHQQNAWNRPKLKTNKTGLKGVLWHKQNRLFRAVIRHNGKQLHLGCFDDPNDAKAAYDSAAKKIHGEFVRLN